MQARKSRAGNGRKVGATRPTGNVSIHRWLSPHAPSSKRSEKLDIKWKSWFTYRRGSIWKEGKFSILYSSPKKRCAQCPWHPPPNWPRGEAIQAHDTCQQSSCVHWWDSGLTPGEGHGNPLQHSYLGNPTDRGVWRATVHGVAKSYTTEHTHNHCWVYKLVEVFWST